MNRIERKAIAEKLEEAQQIVLNEDQSPEGVQLKRIAAAKILAECISKLRTA